MSTVYFDQNVFDVCADTIPVNRLRSILSARNCRLVLGSLNLLEAASCFKDGKEANIKRGKRLFRYIAELLPLDMLIDVPSMMRREVKAALGQDGGSIFLHGAAKEAFENEIWKLARGEYDATASAFIASDWHLKMEGKKAIEDFYGKPSGPRLRRTDVESMPLSDYINHNLPAYERYRKRWTELEARKGFPQLPSRILTAVVKKLMKKPAKYRAFAVGARVNFFMNFKVARDSTFSQDLPTDLKHITNFVYLDDFVTRDRKCLRYGKEILPEKKFHWADDFLGATLEEVAHA